MHTYQDSIDESLKETKSYFEKLYDEISKTLEKISSREKYINSQLEEPMQAFRNYQDRLAEVKETYRNRSTGINDPLIKIKKAMENIKVDMKNMDVRIGVLEHILLQSKLRHKDLIHEQKDK